MFGWKKALGKVINADRQKLESSYSFQHDPHAGHPVLVAKMNRYFAGHPVEGERFRREMEFINELPKKLQDPVLWEVYSVFPYPFIYAYDPSSVHVYFDEEADMHYVMHASKRLYYPRTFRSVTEIQKHYTYLSAEQDDLSPHNYFHRRSEYTSGDVVADLGAAEGNFSLSIVENVKSLFVLESDPLWIEALHKTFEPWKDKVQIIQKFAGSRNDEQMITLDELFAMGNLTVVKMDIEGAEIGVLESSRMLSTAQPLDLMVAAYHRQSDAVNIRSILEQRGFQASTTDGYMLFPYDWQMPPYFRKGMVFGCK
jgi:hypothetical protein